MIDTTTGHDTRLTDAIIGHSPGDFPAPRLTAAALPAAGTGTVVLPTTYWKAFGYSCLAALCGNETMAAMSAAGILPEDPTQRS
jgi:hypothetical protein